MGAPATPLPRAGGAWATLTALRVAGCRFLTDAGIFAALRGCPQLVELDASRCELLEGAFLEALAEAPVAARLERLALAHAGSAAAVAEAFRAHAARFLAPELSLSRLAVLDVSWCPWLGDDELALLARALRAAHGLRALSLHACTRVSGAALQRLGAALPRARLAHLDVGQLPACSDEDLAALLAGPARPASGGPAHAAGGAGGAPAAGAPGLPALLFLDVSSSRTAERTLAAVGQHCPLLATLRCRVAVRVGGTAVRALFGAARDAAEDQRRRELLAAALAPEPVGGGGGGGGENGGGGGSAVSAAAAVTSATPVVWSETLLEEEESWLGDGGDSASVAGSTTTTATLGLGGGAAGGSAFITSTPDRRHAASVTISPRRHGPPPLHELRASALARAAPPAPHVAFALPLLELDLWRSMEVDDASLRLIGAHCPRLCALSIEGCDVAVTDAGVVAVAGGCRELRALSLAGCAVGDAALAAVARSCRALAFLDVSGGADFSRAGLSACVRALTRLRTLRARRCSGVCDAFLRALVAACPLLATLDISSCGQREGEADFVGVTEMGSAAFWRDGAPGPPSEILEEGEGGGVGSAVAGEFLTSRALDILAAATRPPQGRLAVLHVSFVPAVTVEALYRFIRGTCARPSCSLAELSCAAGVATPLLARLLVRRLLLDELPPLAGAAAGPPTTPVASPSVALAIVDAEPAVAAPAAAAAAPAPAPPRSMRELRDAALARLATIVPGMRIS